MRLPVQLVTDENGKKEWSLIELQGELISDTKVSMDLGPLEYKKGVPTLLIGNHLLEEKDGDTTKYTVVGIARKKLIFNTRPKPVLT
ncbi:hypothetical protein THRCLA_20494 [Thraustotheca clavata]|uniref:Chromosome transmission fidelity protein 8 n=1 Tax=Thraustotheca clavata TaxID=74557 RepID=A0A1W0A6U2_9STRA|nr:hypothetical protein THRCLA_20494 [Thraustotheca clavata]